MSAVIAAVVSAEALPPTLVGFPTGPACGGQTMYMAGFGLPPDEA